MNKTLLIERRGAVLHLSLNRPDKRNAMDLDMRDELAAAIQAIRDDRSIHAVLLSGQGGAFCAGGDLRGISSAGLDTEGWRTRMQETHRWLRDLLTLDRPVVAAVEGVAYGAGFSLALAADFVVAAPSARFCMSFGKVGVVPDLGALYTLPRIVGVHKARELMLSAREIDAREAENLGIAYEIQPAEHLLERAHLLAERLAGSSPATASLIKRGLDMSLSSSLDSMLDFEAAAQAIAFSTDYYRIAVGRFIEKKPALFQWPAREVRMIAKPQADYQREGAQHG
ncbi:enoyl-CoA hydratase/isomerase family protein [Stutzerimonas tarimensis]|uniref:Enoyl-CoA hydratase/isomerase family protein n=1 Tax=Stutzerimonas tarimensis TaxID=1507735 RepID=A0ABV7T8X1_9GAMM